MHGPAGASDPGSILSSIPSPSLLTSFNQSLPRTNATKHLGIQHHLHASVLRASYKTFASLLYLITGSGLFLFFVLLFSRCNMLTRLLVVYPPIYSGVQRPLSTCLSPRCLFMDTTDSFRRVHGFFVHQ